MNSTGKIATGPPTSTGNPFHSNSSFFSVHVIIDFVISTPAVLSNAILLITIFRDSRRQKLLWRTPVTLLVVNLSLCDLIAGVVPGYGSLYYDFIILTTRTDERLHGIRRTIIITGIVTNVVGSCTVLAMSFDRLIAVRSPLRYKTHVTRTKIKLFVLGVWIYVLLFASLPRMGVSQEIVAILYCHLHLSLPFIILAVIFWETHRALRWHTNQVRALMTTAELTNEAHRNRERKVLSAILFVLALFYVTFTPQFVALNMLFFHPWLSTEVSFRAFLYTSNKFILISSSVNPFIYAWRIPKYRRALKAIFKGDSLPNQQNSNIVLHNISSREVRTAYPCDTPL